MRVAWTFLALGAMGGWVTSQAVSKRMVRSLIRTVIEVPERLQWSLRTQLAKMPREFLKSAVDPAHLLLTTLAVVVSLMTVALKVLPKENPRWLILAACVAFSVAVFTGALMVGCGICCLVYTDWLPSCDTLIRRKALGASS